MPLLRFGGYGRPVMIACLGTANYYTTVPFTMLLVLLGVVMIGWPRWVIRHTPKNSHPRPDSPRWQTRLFGVCVVVLASIFMLGGLAEATGNPSCSSSMVT
jgi:hypothetical protein